MQLIKQTSNNTYGQDMDLNTLHILDVRLDNIDKDKALNLIQHYVSTRNGYGARKVSFTNVHSIHLSQEDETLQAAIKQMDLALPDGSGVDIAGKVMGQPIRANLNGTDLIPEVLDIAQDKGWSVYLFGAQAEVLEACCTRIRTQFPHLEIAGTQHGYVPEEEQGKLVEEINALEPDLLLVALGSPRQEKWIIQHAQNLSVGVCFAVGGLFDFMSGNKKRAPIWMRRLGIEWLYRLVSDPNGKWDRTVIEMPVFLMRIFRSYFSRGLSTIFSPRD